MSISTEEFLENLQASHLVKASCIDQVLSTPQAQASRHSAEALCSCFIQSKFLTSWQGYALLKGVRQGFFLGKYKLLDRIGSGGMSVVYLGQHLTLDRVDAIKVLDGRRARQGSTVQRFLRECRATASLDHSNVVQVHDYDHAPPHHYLVMEYVDGPSLQDLVDEIGALPISAAAHFIMQAAAGLAAAHRARLIHRDIKPANLLVSSQGVLKVTDLGLARSELYDGVRLTMDENGMLGTADYISPEQALDSHHVTSATDIYSLGASCYFLLTGHPPFAGGTVSSKLVRHQLSEPESPRRKRRDVPPEVEQLCMRMLVKDPAQRPTALEVETELNRWLHAQSGIDLLIAGMLQPRALRGMKAMTASLRSLPPDHGSGVLIVGDEDSISSADGSTLDLLDPGPQARAIFQETTDEGESLEPHLDNIIIPDE
jgi:serine/threonine protein kinase